MKHPMLLAAALLATAATAKIPAPVLDDAAKAKAAEAAAKTAWQTKVDNYLLCKAQDRVAAAYKKTSGTTVSGKDVKLTAATSPSNAPATPAAPAAAPAAAASAPAVSASGTPVAQVAAAPVIPPCTDPGPFAYAPPEQKPLETSGAHSPAPTAASPPSVRPESAQMAPAGAATPQSKKP